jgi:hypothetical protein
MCFAAEIGMFVFGLLALVRGRFTLSFHRAVFGANARIIGVVLMLPLPLVFGFSYVLIKSAGPEQDPTAQELERLARLESRLTLICLLTALGIAALAAKRISGGKTPEAGQDAEDGELPPRV